MTPFCIVTKIDLCISSNVGVNEANECERGQGQTTQLCTAVAYSIVTSESAIWAKYEYTYCIHV